MDVSGQVLRYKVVVSDLQIVAVLYNDGTGTIEEIPFSEERIGNELSLFKENG